MNRWIELHSRRLAGAALVFLLAMLLPGAVAHAAIPTEDPWVIGLDGLGNTMGNDEPNDDFQIEENGGGAAIQIGYLFGPSFLLRFYGAGAVHQTSNPEVDVSFSGGLIEAAYLFRPDSAFRPYLFGGLGGFRAESQEDAFTYSTEGPGVSFGGGLYWFFHRHFALHSSTRLEAVNWDTVELSVETASGTIVVEGPADDSGSALKFTLGLSVWF